MGPSRGILIKTTEVGTRKKKNSFTFPSLLQTIIPGVEKLALHLTPFSAFSIMPNSLFPHNISDDHNHYHRIHPCIIHHDHGMHLCIIHYIYILRERESSRYLSSHIYQNCLFNLSRNLAFIEWAVIKLITLGTCSLNQLPGCKWSSRAIHLSTSYKRAVLPERGREIIWMDLKLWSDTVRTAKISFTYSYSTFNWTLQSSLSVYILIISRL